MIIVKGALNPETIQCKNSSKENIFQIIFANHHSIQIEKTACIEVKDVYQYAHSHTLRFFYTLRNLRGKWRCKISTTILA